MNARTRFHLISLLALLDLATCAGGFGAIAWLYSVVRGPDSTGTVWSTGPSGSMPKRNPPPAPAPPITR